MSVELVNRITIKKDGVYISSHSKNDTAPFTSRKMKLLTEIYNTKGLKTLEAEIIRMFYEYAQVKGQHKSVVRYQEVLNNQESRIIYKKYMDLINGKYNLLSETDKKSQWEEERTSAMNEYIDYETNMRNKMYFEMARLLN